MKHCTERGAVAVEFAIVLPVLLILLLGIAEFGRVFNAQIVITNAAREGSRIMAITEDEAKAQSTVVAASAGLSPGLTTSDFVTTPLCVALDTASPELRYVTVTISYQVPSLTGIFGPIEVGARGVARCDG